MLQTIRCVLWLLCVADYKVCVVVAVLQTVRDAVLSHGAAEISPGQPEVPHPHRQLLVRPMLL